MNLSYFETPRYTDLIIQAEVSPHTGDFDDIVESPKGVIRLCEDGFHQLYLAISRRLEEPHVLVAVSTIKDVHGAHARTVKSNRYVVQFTCNCMCQDPTTRVVMESVRDQVFKVKLPLETGKDFLKIVRNRRIVDA